MKIGNLSFKPYAAKKPVAISQQGNFLSADEVLAEPSLGMGSLFTLSTNLQIKLAVERYSMEPDFKLGIVGMGILTKDEIVDHIETQTEFGQLALQAEMEYCNELIPQLTNNVIPVWPKIPKATKGPLTPVPAQPWKPGQKYIWLKLVSKALFCENTTDGVTAPIANYRINNVHTVFATRGYTVTTLTGVNDDRTNFIPKARDTLTVYIGGVGHGNYNLYTGHAGNHILEVGVYDDEEVELKALHFLSCRTAAQLGPDTITHGAKCYAGYTENFTFVWDDSNTPVNEFNLFMQADSTFDIMMANSTTAQQAYDATRQAFNAAINQVPNTVAATWLTYDRDHFALHGDPSKTILPYRMVRIPYPLINIEKQEAIARIGELVE